MNMLRYMMNYINAAHVLQHDVFIILQYMRCIDVIQHVHVLHHVVHAHAVDEEQQAT